MDAAERIISTAVLEVLAPIQRAYWKQAPAPVAYPLYIAQPQSDISALDWVGQTDVEALITVRALAKIEGDAQLLIEAAGPAMRALSASGYSIKARWLRFVSIPISEGVYTRASVWRVQLTQE